MEKSFTFLLNMLRAGTGKQEYRRINQSFARGPEINRELLMQILRDNRETEYGKKNGFDRIGSVAEYQQAVPVVVYEDVAADIDRMAAGEKNVLTAYPVRHMNRTSGTVGLPKKIPMSQRQLSVYAKYDGQYIDGLRAELLGSAWKKGRNFTTSEGTSEVLPSGITYGCASSVMAGLLRGNGVEVFGKIMNFMFTSPPEATAPEADTDTKYIHTRFALMDKDITGILTGYYSQLCSLFRYIDQNYEMLIRDIAQGTIDPDIQIGTKTRETLQNKVQPMPERAAELKEIFKNGSGICWVPLVWPKLVFIQGVGGDGFSVYDRMIKEKYTGGKIRNIYAGIVASEGIWSVPGGIDTEDSVMVPDGGFYEFLPVEAGDDFSGCVTMDQVQEGQTYELIVTNLSGLYRYRTGDAVQVTGFRRKTPVIRFMYRVSTTISMSGEKTTEKAIQTAVQNAMEELGVAWNDYTFFPDFEHLTYLFLVEPSSENVGVSREQLAECLTRHLSRANEIFSLLLANGRLQKPEACWIQPETMLLYRNLQVHRGESANQVKPVHIIRDEKQRKFFFGLRMED